MAMLSEDTDDQWLYGANPPPPDDVIMPEAPPGDDDEDTVPVFEEGKEGMKDDDAADPDQLAIDETDADGEKPAKTADESAGDTMLDDIDDDSDDDVNVVIREIQPTSAYSGFKIGGKFGTPGADKAKGTFAMNEFDGVGTINGVPSHEFNLDSLDDKPWRKPGADITDFFNYGFTEDTWRAYCDRQKRIRLNDSGAGIANLPIRPFQTGLDRSSLAPKISIPRRHFTPLESGISVIGSGTAPSRRYESAADKVQVPSFSMPPPAMPPPAVPAYNAPPPGFGYPPAQAPPAQPYGYEPTPYAAPPPYGAPPPQQPWPAASLPPPPVPAPEQLQPPPPGLTPAPSLGPDSPGSRYSPSRPGPGLGSEPWSPDRDLGLRERDRERDRDRDRDRDRERERDRDRDSGRHHRERRRSRSPAHRERRSKKNKKRDKDASD